MAKADLPVRNEHRQDECPKNKPSKFITTRCSLSKVAWLQESTSYGGHKIPKGGHRKVSGIVRTKVREEVRREIVNDLLLLKTIKAMSLFDEEDNYLLEDDLSPMQDLLNKFAYYNILGE